jgi:hypothetical protein
MFKTLTLGTLFLGCCLAAAAQTGSMTPQGSSTFPQDQTGQTPSNPASATDPSAFPPDRNAYGQGSSQASMAQKTTVQGCLSRSADGNFLLADKSGNSFQLNGDKSQLSSLIGNEIRVDGTAASMEANPGAIAAPSSSSGPGSATQISVSKVRKVADTCVNSR